MPGTEFFEPSLSGVITNCIVRDNRNEIALDIEHGGNEYTVTLKSTDVTDCYKCYKGEYTERVTHYVGSCYCTVYFSEEDGKFFLFGNWLEDNRTFLWILDNM